MSSIASYYSIFYTWWYGLNKDIDNKNADRAGRARLRRCKSLTEICLEPIFLNLCYQFGMSIKPKDLELIKLAAIAGLLAHIKALNQENKTTIAVQMAVDNDKKNPVKEIRFKKILACKTPEELFLVLLRIIPLISEEIDLKSLVDGIYYWGDNKKREWAYAYYYQLQSTEAK